MTGSVAKVCLMLVTLAVLSACGADGDPIPPTMDTTTNTSTTVAIGVGSSGYVRGGVGLHNGPFSIYFGI